MKRVVSSIMLLVSGIIIGILIYFSEKPEMGEFIVKDTNLLFYSDFSEMENLKKFEHILKEFGYNYGKLGELQKYKGYLKTLLLIKRGEDSGSVIVLDFSRHYLGLRLKLLKYFEKDGELYRLKSEYVSGISEETYLLPWKGYFIVSGSMEELEAYLNTLGEKNKAFLKTYEESKAEHNFFSLVDFENSLDKMQFKTGFKIVRFSVQPHGEMVKIDVDHFENLELAQFFETKDLSKRELTSYIGRNRLYFSNNNLMSFGIFLKNKLSQREQSLIESIGFFTGLSFEEILANLKNELCIDIDKKAMVAGIKKADNYKGILELYKAEQGEFFEISDNLKILIDEKRIYFNSKLEESAGDSLIRDEFLHLNVDLNKLDKKFEPFTDIEVRVSSSDSKFRLSFILSGENLRKIHDVLYSDEARGI